MLTLRNNQFSLIYIKRIFDITFSTVGLIFCFPIILCAWIIASIETRSNGFFIQYRVGRFGKCFYVIKIKTMKKVDGVTTTVTSSDDVRITKSGRFFRRSKIDELPQLLNVFWGQMSFVGPRPDVPGYADKLKHEDEIVLAVRPGITGPASLKYKNEEEILSRKSNPKAYNDNVIWPDYSLLKDIEYIFKTIRG